MRVISYNLTSNKISDTCFQAMTKAVNIYICILYIRERELGVKSK